MRRIWVVVSLIIGIGEGLSLNSHPPPLNPPDITIQLGPVLTINGIVGSERRVEWSVLASGPWTVWTNVIVGPFGATLIDLSVGSSTRYYRSVAATKPTGPADYVWIKPGTFVMGSLTSEADRFDGEVQHSVTLTRGFWMSDHETTQAEYESIMGGNPSRFKGSTLPVEQVSWGDAVSYCAKLTGRELAAGRIVAGQAYRLPTEAEWEYAARAGTTGAYAGELGSMGWYKANSGTTTHAVKGKQANGWGLCDMHGNVFEWCSDTHGAYLNGSVTDPTGATSGPYRVIRGGSWRGGTGYCRSACRSRDGPGDRYYDLGFRSVLSSSR
jgi:formylglycine-generating enzyme required for sulfatase activity